jgi:hypothetical protein
LSFFFFCGLPSFSSGNASRCCRSHSHTIFSQGKISQNYQVKLLSSEYQTSGTCAKRAKQATKKDNAAACLCFLNYLAFLRPAAVRTVSILPWIASRGRPYGFLWADWSI